MHYGPAQNLSDAEFSTLLSGVTKESTRPAVDKVAFLLSYKAGLRVQEIAGLRWDRNILSPSGSLLSQKVVEFNKKGGMVEVERPHLYVDKSIGKYSSDRYIPLHPLLSTAILDLQCSREGIFVIPSPYKKASQDTEARAHALKMRISRIYQKLGFDQCSSHSGRRTFITNAARKANIVGCSIEDVRVLAGHKHINTTQRYIANSPNQFSLVSLV